SSRARAGAPLALAAACGLALAAPAAGQLSEPFPAVFDLETLTAAAGGDGSLGFVVRPQAGHSVASAGDVNGDGVDDVVIGARSASWVVFGQKGGGFAPEISAAALDGSNGFRMVGGGAGFSVSSAGDMNADGVSDVLVAGTGGEAFVVF